MKNCRVRKDCRIRCGPLILYTGVKKGRKDEKDVMGRMQGTGVSLMSSTPMAEAEHETDAIDH